MSLRIFFIIGLVLLSFASCKEQHKEVKPIKIEFKKEGELQVFKAKSDSLIASFDIEFAEDDYEIQTGLMNRYSMDDEHAMLFIFPDMQLRSFYMKNTYIPLDIIYIDEDNIIVSIQANAKPLNETSLPSKVHAQFVLEINAGLTQKWDIAIGDKIVINRT